MLSLIFIGALTSKPYAFSVRPWELERILFFDFFDSLGSEIYLEYFGLSIKRVLPKINKKLNSYWITDRIRFFYDSLNMQRIQNCYINLYTKYKIYSWYGVFLYLKNLKVFEYKFIKISNFFSFCLNYYLNTNVDLYSLLFVKHYFLHFNLFELTTYTNFDNFFLNIDFLHNFFFYKTNFNLHINFFLDYKIIFLFGYNLRCEHPILYIKLLNLVKKKKVYLYIFGSSYINTFSYNIYYLGLTLLDLYNFFFKRFIFNSSKILFLLGSAILNRLDFFMYEKFFINYSNILFKYNIQFYIIKVFFYLLDVNLLFLGIKKDFRNNIVDFINNEEKNFKISLNIFIFENETFFKLKLMSLQLIRLYNNYFMSDLLNVLIFVGSNIITEAQYFNLILPISFFFEHENVFLNLYGLFHKTKFLYAPHTNVKTPINFFNLIYNMFNTLKHFFFFKYIWFFNKYYISNFTKIPSFNFLIKKYYFFNLTYFGVNNFYYLPITIYVYYNINGYLYNINNYIYTNIYSKLSKNLTLAFLARKNYHIYNL